MLKVILLKIKRVKFCPNLFRQVIAVFICLVNYFFKFKNFCKLLIIFLDYETKTKFIIFVKYPFLNDKIHLMDFVESSLNK